MTGKFPFFGFYAASLFICQLPLKSDNLHQEDNRFQSQIKGEALFIRIRSGGETGTTLSEV